MSDLVERLRRNGMPEDSSAHELYIEAAEEIERLRTARPEGTKPEPVDPESEAANPVWDLVVHTCAQAWPAGLLTWNQSPTELIVDIINERDEALAALKELSAMYAEAWDTVNGDLVMMGTSVKRFEAAHAKAEAAIKSAEAARSPLPQCQEPKA